MTHRAGIVRNRNTVHGWVLDLPGCIAGAPKVEELGGPLRLAIAEHIGWLRSHGEQVADDPMWETVEEVDGEALSATGGEFCFHDYRRPTTREDLECSLRLLAYAREELAAATSQLSDAVLDWAPPREAFGHFDTWAPDVRTIRDVARHVLELEVYYRAGLRDGPASGIFEPVGAPWDEHARTVALLRGLGAGALSRSYWPQRPGRRAPEEWTVRKVLARLISHERAHTAEIWQRRSWILLGPPCSSHS